ncbi:MAG: PTS sugar transporter subunit IIB [Elusimicrobiota bacterium]|nr:PTS sugar transporter subunit IIB [Elusimicrobiota bacterium]
MPIVLVRIDDRLVHGQIVQGWLPNVKLNKIAVASEFVANDDMQKLLMRLAVPNTVDLEINTVEDITKSILANAYEKFDTMIIAAKPVDILYMVEKGANFKSVNVGGMHYAKDKSEILPNVFADEDDIKALTEISKKGIELEGRVLPLDERINISEVLINPDTSRFACRQKSQFLRRNKSGLEDENDN